jgi:hypothetical protein
MRHIVATITYDEEAPQNSEWHVEVSELGRGMLATLTDFELKVVATEISLHVRRQIEMPPSPQ